MLICYWSRKKHYFHFLLLYLFHHKTVEFYYSNHYIRFLEIDGKFYYLGIFISPTKEIQWNKQLLLKLENTY